MKKLMMGWLLTGIISVGLILTTSAQTPKGYTLGDAVTEFRVRNVDGRSIALSDYRPQKGLIVVFTSNHCPFSKAYEDRISALDRLFTAQGYPVLAIMPNDPAVYEDDSFENMKFRARDKGYPYPYGIDETQVAKAFGATRTPEVYVLKQTNGQFILEYVGSVDDSPQDSGSVKRRYVEEAVASLLAGRPVQSPITKPIGCGIKGK
jgi:glutathione peroxidase-family protein